VQENEGNLNIIAFAKKNPTNVVETLKFFLFFLLKN
jgi:hypothetical protein